MVKKAQQQQNDNNTVVKSYRISFLVRIIFVAAIVLKFPSYLWKMCVWDKKKMT